MQPDHTVASSPAGASLLRQLAPLAALAAGLLLLGGAARGVGPPWFAQVAGAMAGSAVLGVLLRAPGRWWVIAYAAVAIAALAGVALALGEAPAPALLRAAGPVAGGLIGYGLLRRRWMEAGGLHELTTVATALAIAIAVVPTCQLLAWLAMTAPAPAATALYGLWMAGALGVLAVLPLLLTWAPADADADAHADAAARQPRERRALATLVLLPVGAALWWQPALLLLAVLPLVAAAGRLGPRAVAWLGLTIASATAALSALSAAEDNLMAAFQTAARPVCAALLAALALALAAAQRDRSARALAGAREQVRVVTERGPTLVATLDAQLRHHFANQRYLQWLGKDAAQVLGQTLPAVYADGAELIAAPARRVLAGQPQRQQITLPDGRALDVRFEPRYSSDGPVDGVYLLAQDAAWQSAHERSMDAMLAAAFEPTVVLDGNGAIVRLNDRIAPLLGTAREALLGQSLAAWMQAPGDAALADALAQLRADRQSRQLPRALDLHARRADGSLFPVELHLSALDGARGLQIVVALHDLSPLLAWEQLMAGSRGQAETALDAIADAVVACDLRECITLFNPAAAQLSGWIADDAMGKPLGEVLRFLDAGADAGRAPDAGADLPSLVRTAIRSNQVSRQKNDRLLLRRDDRRVAVCETAAPIRDRFGQASGAVLLLQDVSRAHAQTQSLTHQAQHDHLTGLPNRVLLQDRLSQALARMERGHKGALLYLDLDRFKPINDSYGHPVGDRVLQEVALRLRAGVREDDTVSRQGGDEFVLLLARLADPRDAARVAGKLINAIEQPIRIDGHELSVSASIGIALYPQDGRDTRTLTAQADAALYHAKQAGRGRYSYVADIMSASAEERMRTEHDLRVALANGDFLLAWQPQVLLPQRRIDGVEALVRWRTPDGEVLLPDAFIPVAEETGLVVQIDEWVLREACAQNQRWQQQGLPPVPVSVNVSLARFDAERLLAHVKAVLADTGLDPRWLELEFKGAQLFAQGERGQAMVAALKAHGVRVAVDDFGSGQASLGALAHYAFDTLKIDRQFVRTLVEQPPSRAVIAAILGIGRALGYRVIAKGVESDAQHDALVALGCSAMQGQMFGIAATAVRFAVLVAQPAVDGGDATAG